MNKIVRLPIEDADKIVAPSIIPSNRKKPKKFVSEVSKVEKIGWDLVPARKSKAKKATQRDLAKMTWEPWTDKPKPGDEPFLPDEKLQNMIGFPCRAAYAYMFKTREEQIADFGSADLELMDQLQAIWMQAEEDLKALITLLEGASIRHLAAGCAFVEREQQATRRRARAKRPTENLQGG
jgi:hypothetical protein